MTFTDILIILAVRTDHVPPYLCAYYIIMCTPQEAHISGMETLKMTNSKLHVSKAKITCFKCISQERQSLNRYKFPCKKPIGYGAEVLVVELFYKISKFQLNDICKYKQVFSLFLYVCTYSFLKVEHAESAS